MPSAVSRRIRRRLWKNASTESVQFNCNFGRRLSKLIWCGTNTNCTAMRRNRFADKSCLCSALIIDAKPSRRSMPPLKMHPCERVAKLPDTKVPHPTRRTKVMACFITGNYICGVRFIKCMRNLAVQIDDTRTLFNTKRFVIIDIYECRFV